MSKKTSRKRKSVKSAADRPFSVDEMISSMQPNPVPPNAFTTARVEVESARRIGDPRDPVEVEMLRQFASADALPPLNAKDAELTEREREVRNIDLTLDDITDEGVKRTTITNDSGDEIAVRLMAALYAEAGDQLAGGSTMEDVQECFEYVIKKMQVAVKAMVGVQA